MCIAYLWAQNKRTCYRCLASSCLQPYFPCLSSLYSLYLDLSFNLSVSRLSHSFSRIHTILTCCCCCWLHCASISCLNLNFRVMHNRKSIHTTLIEIKFMDFSIRLSVCLFASQYKKKIGVKTLSSSKRNNLLSEWERERESKMIEWTKEISHVSMRATGNDWINE